EASTARIPVPSRAAIAPPATDVYLPSSTIDRRLPNGARFTILVGPYPVPAADAEVKALTDWLESAGYAVYSAIVDRGPDGVWQRVLAGAYGAPRVAQAELARMKAAAPALRARIVTADTARGAETTK